MPQYVKDNRYTELFVVGSLETLLPRNALARTIRMGLDQLDFSAFDALHPNDEAGRPALDPRSLVGVWILALLRGQTSSVKLAALCGQDIEFRWLLGDAPVEKSTLCAFRKAHFDRITSLGTQLLTALGNGGLLPGENLGVDGTIVRAASSKHSVKTRKGLVKQSQRVETLLRDRLSEEDAPSTGQEQALARHQRKISEALKQMDIMGLANEKDRLTTTEPSAKLLRQKNGSYAPGYNIQVVSDLDSGVIVHTQAIDAGNDCGQLQPQLEHARAVLETIGAVDDENTPPRITADGAYHDTRQLVQLEAQGVTCYVPEDRNTNRKNPDALPEYQADAFVYDANKDTFACPQGQTLTYRKENNTKTAATYQAKASICANCPAKQHCCPKTKGGRSINRPLYKELLDTVAQRVDSNEGREMKRARWITCEGVFARFNDLLHWGRCRLWGEEGVKAELAWRQLAHNLMLLIGVWKPMVRQPNTA